jgi:deazaflavin-dependent oxidoreductase (nitroreductase family)
VSAGPTTQGFEHRRHERMDVLILHTVGRRSGQPRETPVAWFADGEDAWLVVASGGKTRRKSDREYPVVRLTPR